MKDDNSSITNSSSWKPGKLRLPVGLSHSVTNFLAEVGNEVDKAYQTADSPGEMLGLLVADYSWEASETEWHGTTFQNVWRSCQTSQGEQLRVVVSLSSKGALTQTYHMWWK